MRLFYCDPGLTGDQGHHANSCRAIVGECRRRGIEVRVLAFGELDAKLATETGAQRLFRVSTYFLNDGDPVCGWLGAFSTSLRATVEDLRWLEPHLQADDVLYVNSGQAAQLMAWSTWMASCALPIHAVMELGVDPGLDLRRSQTGVTAEVRDPREDTRAILYRFASNEMAAAVAPRLHLATFDPAASEAYQLLLRRPVVTLPNPRTRVTQPRLRGHGQPISVAFLGHQRGEKGYRLVPEILARLERRFPGDQVRFLVHNGEPQQMREVQNQIRQFAAACPRCTLDERRADGALWAEIVDRSDLIVCPYFPRRFAFSYSALACDAVANGIPFIGPAGTTLERLGRDFGTGAAFVEWTVDSIVRAIEGVLQQFDDYAKRAMVGADLWAQQQGPAHCLDAILRLAGK
jgi:hypothetical protein